MKKIFLFAIVAFIAACSSTVATKLVEKGKAFAPLNEDIPVYLLSETELVPYQSQLVGGIKIGGAAGISQNCSYLKAVSEARTAARKAGANIIKISEAYGSDSHEADCYHITASIYRNLDEKNLSKIKNFRKSTLPENCNYAMVYFYRVQDNAGAHAGYPVRILANDSILCKLRIGEKFAYKTTLFGKKVLYAESKSTQTEINIEKGQEYYVRCEVNVDFAFGKSQIGIVENLDGRKQYSSLK
ncbi:MAG TPA: hypothetical protein VK476_07115 [Flavobacterium sp.]|nr:hypothetical protein [Flavobacterium sp.]